MISYRQAHADDEPALARLLGNIMHHHGVSVPHEDRLHAVIRAALGSEQHSFLVAEEEGTIVGMCALLFSYSTWSAALVCELQDVIVLEESRRSRVGEGLIHAAEGLARERGCTNLHLLAESWNLDAHAFYRSLGLAEKTCLYFERDLRPR